MAFDAVKTLPHLLQRIPGAIPKFLEVLGGVIPSGLMQRGGIVRALFIKNVHLDCGKKAGRDVFNSSAW